MVDPNGHPRAVARARWAAGIATGSALIYLCLGIVEYTKVTEAKSWLLSDEAISGASDIQEQIIVTLVMCLAVVVLLGPIWLFPSRVGPRTRIAAIAACAAVVALSPLIMVADIPTMLRTQLFGGGDWFSQAVFEPWFPPVHYFAVIAVLLACVAGLIALATSDAGEYFRRRRQGAEDDPRLWSISTVRPTEAGRSAE